VVLNKVLENIVLVMWKEKTAVRGGIQQKRRKRR